MSKEVWKPIPTHEGYDISNHGRIRSWIHRGGAKRTTPYIKKPWRTKRGYYTTKTKFGYIYIHRTVLTLFNSLPPTDTHQAAHIDGNQLNNAVDNLYWATQSENEADKKRYANVL